MSHRSSDRRRGARLRGHSLPGRAALAFVVGGCQPIAEGESTLASPVNAPTSTAPSVAFTPAPRDRAPPEPAPPKPARDWTYRALGTEPFWSLDAHREKPGWTLTQPGEPPLYGDVVRFEGLDGAPTLAGTTLDGVPFRLVTRAGPCSDGMSDRLFAHHATVTVGALRLTGCGGAVLRPATLEGTRWRFLSLDGERLTNVETSFDIHGRDISARVACNHFEKSGTWAANDRYVGGPALATQAGCREATREAALGRLMAGEMRFRFAPDGTMTVTGGGVTARLRRSV